MASPSCKRCSKVIPDGFVDCPWCGAKQTQPTTGPLIVQAESPPALQVLYGSLSLVSIALVIAVNYVATGIAKGPVFPENSGYFIGACCGSFLLSAVGVFLFYKWSHRQASNVMKLMLISACALLPASLGLGNAIAKERSRSDATAASHLHGAVTSPAATPIIQNKWDRVAAQFLTDVRDLNQQYISEVSRTEPEAPALLSLESFRDTATLQTEIACVQARLAVNEKYDSPKALLDQAKGDVSALDASDQEKRKFLQLFLPRAQALLALRKAASDAERNYLLASVGVYGYASAHEGEYALNAHGLVFTKDATSSAFHSKLSKARQLNTDFLMAYSKYRYVQDSALAQMGVPPSDPLPSQPK